MKKFRGRKKRDIARMEEKIRRRKEKQIRAQKKKEMEKERELARIEEESKREEEAIAKERQKIEQEKESLTKKSDTETSRSKTKRETVASLDNKSKQKISSSKETRKEKRARLRREKDEERIRRFEEREMERRRAQAVKKGDTAEVARIDASIKEKAQMMVMSDDPEMVMAAQNYKAMSLDDKIKAQRDEITQLLDERNSELRHERERIFDEFKLHLDALYRRGEAFYNKTEYEEALRIFVEVDEMERGYKETDRYIANMREMNVYHPSFDESSVVQSTKRGMLNTRTNVISNALDSIENQMH